MSNLFCNPVVVNFNSGKAVFEHSQATDMNFKFTNIDKVNTADQAEYEILIAEKFLLVFFKVQEGDGDKLAQEIADLIDRRVIKRIKGRAVKFFDRAE